MEHQDLKLFQEKLTALCTDPDCPACRSLLLFKGKWNIQVLFTLCQNPTLRFGEFKKRLPGITSTMLTATLKDLEQLGVVTRTQYNEIPPKVEYSLSESGMALMPGFYEIALWGDRYMR